MRSRGLRVTNPRISVIEALGAAKEPLSISEIINAVAKKGKNSELDKVSVYRTVETLRKCGLLHAVGSDGKFFRCEHTACAHAHHIMLRCLRCLGVKEVSIEDKYIRPLIKYLSSVAKFELETHEIQAGGICKQCSESAA